MAILIYNSLTREKEPLETVNKDKVGMYACGPTVYDEPHIGHARSAYIFDVIRRYLKYRGYQVRFVRNVTDVDDKIIEKAKQEYPNQDLDSAVKKISDRYLKSYREAMNKLGIEPPDKEPKATEYIDKMQAFIKILIERGVAYEAGGDVYFDIKKAKNYGCLSHQSLENMQAGTRITPGENKRDPLDFALWKKAKEGEPSWDSSWGKGRPGWHIECSVMSSDILGDEFDIHGGGLDLIFPHHENELAQSQGAGKKFARYWMHHGLLTINGQKMSKSLGNFVTITDFIGSYNDADLLKLFFLSTHYLHPIDYTEEKIEEAKKQKKGFDVFFDKVYSWSLLGKKKVSICSNDRNRIDSICAKFEQVMDEDFNTPQALAFLFELVDLGLGFIALDKEEGFIYVKSKLVSFFNVLGFKVRAKEEIPEEVKKKLEERNQARAKKDFKRADALRREIEKLGYAVSDTSTAVTVTFVNKNQKKT